MTTSISIRLCVDLYGVTNIVSGVIIQGAPNTDEWVESFKVRTGIQECNLNYIVGADIYNPVIFTGNYDSNTEVTNYFPQPVTARFVRIEPTAWKVKTSLRFEVTGCFTNYQPPVCETGWKGFGSYCYYFDDIARVPYAEAETACQNLGAKLVSIHSQDENDFVGYFAKHDGVGNSWFGWWIGLDDRTVTYSYQWVDGTSVDFLNWIAGEPNRSNENCAKIAPKKGEQWYDVSCTLLYPYICKKAG
ncbi:echinoidin-like [Amphiura filiformis]|uniref:echinoidin-like n=1 Tax=Amphiura filiformis TaxID=82378 RepID=UPI003B20BFFC